MFLSYGQLVHQPSRIAGQPVHEQTEVLLTIQGKLRQGLLGGGQIARRDLLV